MLFSSFNVLPLQGFAKRANTPVINTRKDQWRAKALMIKTNGMSIGYWLSCETEVQT